MTADSPDLGPPLADLLVIDLTRALAGPYCTLMFGDLGARIIKIEPLDEVDSTRGLAPHLAPGMSSYFASINRNKKALSLNLKHPRGVEVFKGLVKQADVVIDNFRPGTMERFGIRYDELRESLNPGLVSCSISGFGTTGAYRQRSSFDLVVQAMGGAMSVTGEPGGAPVRLGLPIGDLGSGMFAGIGILSALHARALTGLGRHVEISMLDSMAGLLTYMGAHYLQTGEVPGPQGSGHLVNVPYQAFQTSDGWLVIAIFGERYWKELCEVLELAHLSLDERYRTSTARSGRRDELLAILKPVLLTRTADDWLDRMLARNIPCAPINTVDKVMNDPVLTERHMIVETDHPAYGRARAPGNPIKVEGVHDGAATAAPMPGEHSDAILQEYLQMDAAQLKSLHEERVI